MRTATSHTTILAGVLVAALLSACGGAAGDDPDDAAAAPPTASAEVEDADPEGDALDPAATPIGDPEPAASDAVSDDILDGDCRGGDGQLQIDGADAITFLCGTATATVTYGDTTEELSGGRCEYDTVGFSVGFGVASLAISVDGRPDYLGAAAFGAATDGSYETAAIRLERDGQYVDVGTDGLLVLDNDRTSGSFSADGLEATFSCD